MEWDILYIFFAFPSKDYGQIKTWLVFLTDENLKNYFLAFLIMTFNFFGTVVPYSCLKMPFFYLSKNPF